MAYCCFCYVFDRADDQPFAFMMSKEAIGKEQ